MTVNYTDSFMRRAPQTFKAAVPTVLDYTTTRQPSVPNSNQPAMQQQPAQSTQQSQGAQQPDLQGMINAGIGQLSSTYDNSSNYLQDQLKDQYGSVVQGINNERDQALEKFPGYQQQIEQNQSKSLGDLSNDVRNSMQAANNYLGSRGSSSPSAERMYAFAIQQGANKNRATVQSEYGNQFKQLQDQEIDVRNQATNAITQADQWMAGKKAEIVAQYQGMKDKLSAQGMQMSFSQAQDFTNYMRNLQDKADSYKQQVLGGFQERVATLNNAKLQMSNSSNFNPQQVAAGELNATAQYAPQAQDYAYSFYPQLKKQNQPGYSY